jgi:hypothetical protein
MNAFVSLAPEFREKNLQIGDLVQLEFLLEEKVGDSGDAWKIKEAGEKSWVGSGSFSLSGAPLKGLPSEGNTTKLSVPALIHQPSTLQIQPVTLLHVPSGKEFPVPAQSFKVEIPAPTQQEEQSTWTLPPVSFGDWNYPLIATLLILLLAALGLAIAKFLQRRRANRKRNHKEEALLALQDLQKFARSRKGLEQTEWKKFSFSLAGTLRKYANENFQIDSSDMTDRELLAELKFRPKAAPHTKALATILGTIDEVRYGKKDLDSTVVPGLLLEARQFVEATFQAKEEGEN